MLKATEVLGSKGSLDCVVVLIRTVQREGQSNGAPSPSVLKSEGVVGKPMLEAKKKKQIWRI